MSVPTHTLFRIRFVFSDNGILYSKIAIVRAATAQDARNRLSEWFIQHIGIRPDFSIKSCQIFRDVNLVIGYDTTLHNSSLADSISCNDDMPDFTVQDQPSFF